MEDTRLYIKKELSILNSISDNYPQYVFNIFKFTLIKTLLKNFRAVLSNSSKDEFLKQLEGIADGVHQSKMKVERKFMEEKQQRDKLSHTLQSLVEQQRRYVGAIRQLSIECKKHEELSSLNMIKS